MISRNLSFYWDLSSLTTLTSINDSLIWELFCLNQNQGFEVNRKRTWRAQVSINGL